MEQTKALVWSKIIMGIPASLPLAPRNALSSQNQQIGRKASERVTVNRRGTVKTLLRLLAATQSCWSEYPEVKG